MDGDQSWADQSASGFLFALTRAGEALSFDMAELDDMSLELEKAARERVLHRREKLRPLQRESKK